MGCKVYDLSKKIRENKYLDFFELLKEEGKIAEAITKDNVARTYLIFDYDGHANKESSQKLQEMLSLFVAVLSAFPIMLLDYYGISTLKEKIE